MGTVNKWSAVQVAMQSAIDGAKTISDISKASEGAVSCTGNGYSNGDYVLIKALGMWQVNGIVARVKSAATDSFVLEGIDTTDFDTFTSGTAEKLTFGTSLSTVTGVTGSGGDFNFIDTTTIHNNTKTQIPGVANAMAFSFENLWDVSDAALVAMKTASDSQAERAFMFTFATGQRMVFNGYVGASLIPGGSTQDKVTTKVDITAFGRPVYYAS
jgi:hypothetical protein